jgi:outer membrane protein
MKRVPLVVILLVLGSALAVAQTAAAPAAQTPAAPKHEPSAPAGPLRVAVIAFQAAVGQTNEFQRDFADLQKKYDPRRQQLKTLSDEVDSLTKELQNKGASLTDAERATRAHALDEKKKQLDRETQDAQTDFQADMQVMINRIASKVGAVMTDYAQAQGYTLVLDASDQQSPIVLYATENNNITRQVIDAYNAKSGVPAPPPAVQSTPEAPQPSPTH